MWPFKRNKAENGKTVPAEVKEYYASEHRERVGLAWLIAFLSLILTVVIIAGLFFGGRWVYRKVANHNKPQTTGQSTTESSPVATPSSPSTPNNLQPAAPSQNQSGSSNSSNGSSTNSSNSGSSSSNNSSSSSSSSDNSSAAGTGSSSSQPAEGKTGSTVTNTGPGDTVAIFVGAVVVGTVVYQVYLRRKLTNN